MLRRLLIVVRGVAIALPLLLLFGALLASADEAFAKLLTDFFRIDIAELFAHIFATAVYTVLVAGLLRSTLNTVELPAGERPRFLHLGAAETNIAIGLVDLLFAAFVAVQFRYFFGGAALVRVSPKLTYAQYARHGFFELVWVAALVIPMLLFAEWVIARSGIRTFRLLAIVQVVLVAVMLVSAYRRMQLYVDEFGLTELRLYTTAFMFWLAALLAWFSATVLTGHRQRFFIGALATGVAVIVTLHAMNPDDLIVRTNIANAARGKRPVDTALFRSLSADAVPAILSRPDLVQPCDARALLAGDFRRRGDSRSWNASRAGAQEAIAAQRELLVTRSAGCVRNDNGSVR